MPILPIAEMITASAPIIGRMLYSEDRDIISLGIKFIAMALECPSDLDAIQKRISENPDDILLIKAFEDREYVMIGTQLITLERIEQTERRDVRSDDTIRLQYLVAGAVIILMFVCISAVVWLFTAEPPSRENTALIALLSSVVGGIMGKLDQLTTFCFGSTSGSRIKDEMLYNSTPKR